MFKEYGTITGANVQRDRVTGVHKGVGFVTFSTCVSLSVRCTTSLLVLPLLCPSSAPTIVHRLRNLLQRRASR